MGTPALTRTAMAHLKAEGRFTGGQVPYGYRLAADGKSLDVEPAEVAVMAEARKLRAAGLSLRAVGAELGRRGFVSRSGRPWQAVQIARMLEAAGGEVTDRYDLRLDPTAGLKPGQVGLFGGTQ